MAVLTQQKFQEVKEKVEKVFNCSVERGGDTEIVVDVMGYGMAFTVTENNQMWEGEATPQPVLTKPEKKVINAARKYIKAVIKETILNQ